MVYCWVEMMGSMKAAVMVAVMVDKLDYKMEALLVEHLDFPMVACLAVKSVLRMVLWKAASLVCRLAALLVPHKVDYLVEL